MLIEPSVLSHRWEPSIFASLGMFAAMPRTVRPGNMSINATQGSEMLHFSSAVARNHFLNGLEQRCANVVWLSSRAVLQNGSWAAEIVPINSITIRLRVVSKNPTAGLWKQVHSVLGLTA